MEASATYRNLRTVLLAGGVGGARMARGLAAVVEPENMTVVVNVGDDAAMYGALVCADLDTVTYTLAGIEGPHGWGITDDTFVVMDQLAAAGIDTTFRLGDRDLAHCLARTVSLESGGSLSQFTRHLTERLGVTCAVLPASDDPIRTKVATIDGELLDFQDYFVLRGQRDTVAGLTFRGAPDARPAPGVLAAVTEADLVIIAPSNPPLSIWPMLAMGDLKAAVRSHRAVVAVSPLIAGKAVKGPLVEVMGGLGLSPTQRGIVQAYDGLLHHLVIDSADSTDRRQLEDMGVGVTVTDTHIADPQAAARLATLILEQATAGDIGRRSPTHQ